MEDPLHPIVRFLIAAVIAVAVNWAAGTLSFGLLPRHPLMADALYRAAGAVALIAVYGLLLGLLDRRSHGWGSQQTRYAVLSGSDRLRLQGLPLGRLACRQFFAGLGIGVLLIVVAVLATACLGRYRA